MQNLMDFSNGYVAIPDNDLDRQKNAVAAHSAATKVIFLAQDLHILQYNNRYSRFVKMKAS